MSVQQPPHKSTVFGLDANIVAALAYIASIILSIIPFLGTISWLAPLILYFVEKDSFFVKKHAMQAFLLGCVSGIGSILFIILASFSGLFSLSSLFASGVTGSASGAAGSVAIFLIPVLIGAVLWLTVAVLVIIAKIFGIIGAAKYQEIRIPLITAITEKLMKNKN